MSTSTKGKSVSVGPMEVEDDLEASSTNEHNAPLLSEYYDRDGKRGNGLSVRPRASVVKAVPFTQTSGGGTTRLIEVTAPSTLPAGYVFDVNVGNVTFPVEVPSGGVKEGEKFRVPDPTSTNDDGISHVRVSSTSGPVGHWKDGVCDCCILGVRHPTPWLACCCRVVLLGQIMTRLKTGFFGIPAAYTFKVALCIAAVQSTFLSVMYCIQAKEQIRFFKELRNRTYYDPQPDPINYGTTYYTCYLMASSLGLYVLYAAVKTRASIREKYAIPQAACDGCEDCCCIFCCGCCTISQMARHTADYETYPGRCCSETGLSPNAPSIV